MSRSPVVAVPAARAGRRPSTVWVQGLVCGGLLTVLPSLALMLAMLLWPLALAAFMDRAPGRPLARSVGLCGAAGCVGPLRALLAAGFAPTVAWKLACDPVTIGTAWGAAGAGWLLAELAPLAVRLVLEAVSTAQAVRLRAERSRLGAQFGLGEAPPDGG